MDDSFGVQALVFDWVCGIDSNEKMSVSQVPFVLFLRT